MPNLKSFYEYTILGKCGLVIGINLLFLALGFLMDFLLDGTLAINKSFTMMLVLMWPIVDLSGRSGGASRTTEQYEQLNHVLLVFSSYLLCLAALSFLSGFPASRALSFMPIVALLLLIVWGVRNQRAAEKLGQ